MTFVQERYGQLMFREESEVIVLEKNLIPYSITTINDSGNETLLVGTTSGQIIEVTLP